MQIKMLTIKILFVILQTISVRGREVPSFIAQHAL